MKKITLLLVSMWAAGLGREINAFSEQAAAAGAPREIAGAQTVYEPSTERPLNAFDKNHRSDQKKGVHAGPTDEVEAKRLKLMFLLMMSLGPYHAPVR